MPALKEWAAAIAALLAGRQALLLRKGGIHEKRFTVARSAFLLYPTVAHSHAESTRPEHHDLLDLGARDVWRGPAPDPADDPSDARPRSVTLRAAAEVVAAIDVQRPEHIDRIEPLHLWTTESVRQNRIDFRPRHRLAALVVRVHPLLTPRTIDVRPEYGGCRSWVDVVDEWADLADVALGPPVLSADELSQVEDQVRRTVG